MRGNEHGFVVRVECMHGFAFHSRMGIVQTPTTQHNILGSSSHEGTPTEEPNRAQTARKQGRLSPHPPILCALGPLLRFFTSSAKTCPVVDPVPMTRQGVKNNERSGWKCSNICRLVMQRRNTPLRWCIHNQRKRGLSIIQEQRKPFFSKVGHLQNVKRNWQTK